MARINNTKRVIAVRILSHLENHIHKINNILKEELNLENKFSNSHVTSRNQAAIDEGAEILKKFRWYWEDQINQSILPAYTDAEIDVIDEDIRTHEDE